MLFLFAAFAGAQTLPPDVERGKQWLASQVGADGRLSDASLRLSTERQAEAEAIETLDYLGSAPAALVQRHAGAGVDPGVEHLARRIVALARADKPVGPLLGELRALQNGDGGFGGSAGRRSTVLDTSLALIAFRVAGIAEGADIARALDYLVARSADSASSDWQMEANARPYVSAYALLASQMHSVRYPIAASVSAQRQALIAQQGGGRYAEVLLDTVAALALQYGSTGETGLAELRTSIRAAQGSDGSWSGDTFLTALALRALAQSVLPPPSTDGRILLRVRDAATLAYLSGARLAIAERSDLLLQSGSDGRIDSGALVPGTYTLTLAKDGYRNRDLGSLALVAGQTRDLGVVDLGRNLDVAVLFGRVTDVGTTQPLAGVSIEVGGAQQAQAQTAPDGSFEMVFPAGGEIQVRASRPGYQSVTGNGTLVVGQSLRFSPALYPEGGQVPSDATLTATVIDASTEAPLAGARLVVGARSALSDAQGRVQLDGLAAGNFSATVEKTGYRSASLAGSLVAGANDAGTVRLSSDAAASRSSLSGRVTDASNGVAIAGASVAIVGTALRGSTDGNGSYRIGGIEQVPFTAIVTAPGFATQQVQAGNDLHGDFQANFALQKLAAADVQLESVVMSAPEVDPFTEVGVLGTVKNLGTDEVGIVFSAVVSDAAGRVLRDVPHVQITMNRTFDDTVIRFAPGESKPITIIWGSLNDAPGEYRVLFRGTAPDGRVLLEGPATYRVRAVKRLGGGVLVDPPLIQAGTGQAVSLDADLTNMGNLPIPAGNVKLSVVLAAKDDRPPLPAKPAFGAPLAAGTPLSRPFGLTRDEQGNVYTINRSSPYQLIRIAPDGSMTVLRNMPTNGPGNAALSSVLALSWRAPNLLRVAWISGWVADVDLDNGGTISNYVAPPAGVTANSVGAYTFDAASGKEYFGATHQGRPRVLLRQGGGAPTVLIDAGMTQGGPAVLGPDGKLYVVNASPGAVFRIDPASRAIEPLLVGLTSPRGLVFDGAGTLYVSEGSSPPRVRKLVGGALQDWATGFGASVSDLQLGRDGRIYGIADDGSIRRIEADGTHAVFARGILHGVQGVAADGAGGLYAHNGATVRHLTATGELVTLNNTQSVTSLMADGPAGPLVANATSLLRLHPATAPQVLLTPATLKVRLLAPLGGDVALAGFDGSRAALGVTDRSGFAAREFSPFASALEKLYAAADGSVLVVNNDSIVRIAADGSHALVARFVNVAASAYDRSREEIWINSSSEGLLRIDLASGARTRVRNYIAALQYDAAVDAAGLLTYSDSSARKIVKYDPVANVFSDVTPTPASIAPAELALAPDGTMYVRFTDYALRRFDAPAWTTVDSSWVYEVLTDRSGRVGYRKNQSIFAAPAAGGSTSLLSVLVEWPDFSAWLGDDSFLAYQAARTQLKHMNAAGGSLRNVYGMSTPSAMAATPDGTIYVLDSQKDLTRAANGTLTRLGRFSNAYDIRARGSDVLLSQRDGFFRLNPDATVTAVQTVPGWAAGQYSGFGVDAERTVAFNRTSEEIVVLTAAGVQARYQPFANPTALAQQADGSWLVASNARIALVEADAGQSRQFSALTNTNDLQVRPDGTVLATNATELVRRLDENGTPSNLAGPLSVNGVQLSSVADGAAGLFAVNTQGVVFRLEEGYLKPFAAGVGAVNTILPRADGSVLVTSASSTTILEARDGRVSGVATGIEGPRSMCALDGDTLGVVGNSYLAIVDLGGGVNFVAQPSGVDPYTLLCLPQGQMLMANYGQNQILSASAGTQTLGLQVGDVAREQVVPMAALGLEGNQRIAFDDWVPSEGGDYEIRVVPLDPEVEGSLLSGIHVGPAAVARMTVAPATAVPGDADIRVDTQLEGADFTRLSRIDHSQLRLAGNSVYPSAMSLDPSGQLWYQAGAAIYRTPVGSLSPTRVGTVNASAIRGELPIDAQGRAFIVLPVSGKYELRRLDSSGAHVKLTDFGSTPVVSMTIDGLDRLFVLTSDNKVHLVQPDGTKSHYATAPGGASPFGITRDGAGGLYVQQHGNRIVYVSPTLETSLMDLRGAVFEYEGVNIAGDCGEGMFMTPMSLPGTGQSGEEHTVVQLVGRTGEIGTVINGRVISPDLVDMDFITYDRFGSRLLIMSESNGNKLYTVPVTCGAIDIDLHVVLAAGQPFHGADPVPNAVLPRADGSVEYVWTLRDVNRQGVSVAIDARLLDLVRGERRPAVQEAFAMLKNSFQPAPVRVEIDVPQVLVRDLVEIGLALDREEYPQQTPVGIALDLANTDDGAKSARLVTWVEDGAGTLVETLIDRQQPFGPLETLALAPPYNTGTLRVGAYRAVAELRDELGGVVARASDDFRVVAGGGGPTLTSTVATDKPVYQVGETARILANVQNLSANSGFAGLTVSERVLDASGATRFTGSLPLANLEASAQARLSFDASLAGYAAGFYDVQQEVRDAQGTLLDARTTRFEVVPLPGASALSGALSVDPAHVRRGRAVALAATLVNRGSVPLENVQSVLRVMLPGTTQVLGEWTATHAVAVGESVPVPVVDYSSAGLALRDYLGVLSARVNGEERALAQKAFVVEDVVFAGTLQAEPSDVRQGDPVAFAGGVTNSGNLAATDATVRLVVADATTGQLLRDWTYPASIAAGATHPVADSLDSRPLPLGPYVARLSVLHEGREQPLAEDGFTVRNFRITGVFDADPALVRRGEPVDLEGVASNTGNLAADPLPLRIEVLKVDTGAVVLSLDEPAALQPGGSFTMLRRADTRSFVAGVYEGVFSAHFGGQWHVLSSDRFEVVRPVEIEIGMDVPRDARVLVLMSCSQHQAQLGGVTGGHAQTVCEQRRQAFLSQYLTERGIEHRIVLDQDSFMRELRCGRYNVFWFSGGAVKLGVAEALEVRESIYRGDGFIVEGDNDQRNSQFDEMLGLNFRGHHARTDLEVLGSASLFPAVAVPAYGRMLRLETTTGTVEARFPQVDAPAIVSSGYGQGRALSYGFDLVEVLRRDGASPAQERLLTNALVHVAPLAGSGYVDGAYVPVTTTVQNRGDGFDARLETRVAPPAAIASSAPQATEGDAQHSAWEFALAENERRSFDANVLTGGADGTEVRSQAFDISDGGLEPLGNAQLTLARFDAAAAGTALLEGLRSAALQGGEAAARDRAIRDIEAARAADAGGDTAGAIDKWLDASDEVRRITSVSHSQWRLAIARLLAATQHRGCNSALRLCGTTPAQPVAFDASAFLPRQRLGRAQAGGAGQWEWQLADREAAAPTLRVDLDWSRNQAVEFTLEVDASGNGRLELRQAGTLKASVATDAATHGRLLLGDALQLVARNSPDVGRARLRLAALRLDGSPLAGTLETATDDRLGEARLSLFAPAARERLRLQGTVQLEYTGNAMPEGSRLELEIASGQLQCNGGTR